MGKKKKDIKIEKGLHYHNGWKYEGEYHNGKTNGNWSVFKDGDLVSTIELKDKILNGVVDFYNNEGDVIFRRVFDNGKMLETLGDINPNKEIMNELFTSILDEKDLWMLEDLDFELGVENWKWIRRNQ